MDYSVDWDGPGEVDCDCMRATVDTLTGEFYCPECGYRKYLSSEELHQELEFEAECQRAWEEEQHQEEMRQLENQELERHYQRHPHG